MKKNYPQFLINFILVTAITMLVTSGLYAADDILPDTTRKAKNQTKITDTRSNRPSDKINIKVVPFKPSSTATAKTTTTGNNPSSKTLMQDTEKALSNVKIYPNPVADELNLTYNIGKEANVTIKIMDVLGNEITTLVSKKMPAGEQNNTFNISSKLNSGFYFIRLIVGNESVVKRISVL